MTFTILWLVFGLTCLIGAFFTKDATYIKAVNMLLESYNTTNLLIAAGVIGICSRLDGLKKQ